MPAITPHAVAKLSTFASFIQTSYVRTFHYSAEEVSSNIVRPVHVTDVCLFPGTKLDAPRLGRTASSCVSRSCRAPGGETIRCQIEQDCQDDPEPAPPGHTSSDVIDQDVGQGGNRQEEDSQQW
jgi:hypothetical protein